MPRTVSPPMCSTSTRTASRRGLAAVGRNGAPTAADPAAPLRDAYGRRSTRVEGFGRVCCAPPPTCAISTVVHLTTYGIDEDLGDALDLDLEGLRSTVAPRSTPTGATRCSSGWTFSWCRLSHASRIRSSRVKHSTRRARDLLGHARPEEVVVDGENGLVVRRARPRDARDGDAQRRGGSRACCAASSTAPRNREGPIDRTQVLELETRYEALLNAPSTPKARPSRARPSSIRRVVFAAGIEGAPLRYRVRLPAEALKLRGVESQAFDFRNPRLCDAVDEADALYVYRVPASPEILGIIDRAKRRGIPVLFDVDDLIFDPDIAQTIPALRLLPEHVVTDYLDGVRRYRTTLEHCDGYVGSTRMLVDHARAATGLPAARFENGVGLLLARVSDRVCAQLRPARARSAGLLQRHDHPRPRLGRDRAGGHRDPRPSPRRASRARRAAHHGSGTGAIRGPHRTGALRAVLQLPQLLHSVDINLAPLQLGFRSTMPRAAIKWPRPGSS